MPGGRDAPVRDMRAHHLLCALGFRGHGYSEQFTRNMAEILAALDADPRAPVRVLDAPDAICAAFPSDQPAHCAEERVLTRDRRVLAALGLCAGHTASWGELRARVGRAFVPADLDRLCATCPWLGLGYCGEGLADLNARAQAYVRPPRNRVRG